MIDVLEFDIEHLSGEIRDGSCGTEFGFLATILNFARIIGILYLLFSTMFIADGLAQGA